MLTREQKQQLVQKNTDEIKKSHNLVFVDFAGIPVSDISRLKAQLRAAGVQFKIVKKRLLDIALKRAGIEDMDVMNFKGQVVTAFVPGELTDAASPISKFQKEMKKAERHFEVLGAYDVAEKNPISMEDFAMIASLPSREVMLAIVAGAFAAPISAFMYLLKEIAKQKEAAGEVAPAAPVAEAEKPVSVEGAMETPAEDATGQTESKPEGGSPASGTGIPAAGDSGKEVEQNEVKSS